MSDESKRNPPPANPDPARARTLRDERIDHIMTLMCDGEWGASAARRLAKEWGLAQNSVSDYASVASSIIRHVVQGDADTIRTSILAGIEAVRKIALEKQRSYVVKRGDEQEVVEVPDPDCKAALASYDLQAKVLGLVITKVETVNGNESPEETLAKLDEAREKLRAAIETKRAERN